MIKKTAVTRPLPPLPPTDDDFTVRLFQAGDYDHLWSMEIARRLTGYSLLGVGILAILAFFGSYVLSRKAMRPLTEKASLAGSLNAADLTSHLEQRGPKDEISQLAAGFNGMLDRLQSAFHELEQFNAFASHELRNALAVVRTRLEVGLAAADHRGALQDALMATVRLSHVVDDMLALSTPLTAAQTEPVDLALVAAEAVDTYTRPGRLLELDLPEEGVPPVRGHAAWLQRAIANLLDNAFKYGPEDGPVRVRVERRAGAVVVSVADQGPGIPAEARCQIWESFRRLGHQSRKPGTGLGLALVKHAVEAAGGKVWVESTQREGSTFYLEVPTVG
ncbi:MAG: ATP-binding protein [Bacteroidota bacterium]